MNRALKVLGIAAVAALAMSVVASAAQATEFTASEYPSSFHGSNTSGEEVFSTEAGDVKCDSEFSGEAKEASSSVTAHAEYSECEAFGFVNATVDTEGCDYVFNLPAEGTTATVDVACGEGESIKITAASCAAEVGAQEDLEHVGFANGTGETEDEVEVTATATEIAYTVTKDGFLCPFSGTGTKEDGSYTTEGAATKITDDEHSLDVG